jgi:hypothetical protein
MTDQQILQLENDLSVLLNKDYRHAELATEILQREDPNEVVALGKRPVLESFAKGPVLSRNGRIQDHFGRGGGVRRPEACLEG